MANKDNQGDDAISAVPLLPPGGVYSEGAELRVRILKRILRGKLTERPKDISEACPIPRMQDRRAERVWPALDLSIEQIEGMFCYDMPMDYNTPFGVLHITPDPEHVWQKAQDRRGQS